MFDCRGVDDPKSCCCVVYFCFSGRYLLATDWQEIKIPKNDRITQFSGACQDETSMTKVLFVDQIDTLRNSSVVNPSDSLSATAGVFTRQVSSWWVIWFYYYFTPTTMVVWYNRVVIGVGPLSVRFRSLHVSVAKTEPKLCPISSLRPSRLYLRSSTNSFPNKVTFEKDKNPASRRPPACCWWCSI